MTSGTVEQQIEGLLRAKTRRRRLRWFLGSLLLPVVLGLLAPTLISRTALRTYVLSTLIPRDAGSLSMESLRIGWFTPLSASGVRFVDPAGESLLSIEQLTNDRSLLELARAPTNLGTTVVKNLKVWLLLRSDGSNLEDVLGSLSDPGEAEQARDPSKLDSPLPSVAANIQFVNAELIATDVDSQAIWRIEAQNVAATVPQGPDETWEFTAQGALDGQPFELNLRSSFGLATHAWPLGPVGSATVRAESLPAGPLRYAAVRSRQNIDELQGTWSCDLAATWQPGAERSDTPELTIQGLVRMNDLVVADTKLLGPDILRIGTAQLQTQLQASHDSVVVQQARFESDYGEVSLVSSVSWSNTTTPGGLAIPWQQYLRHPQLSTQGKIDLAALCRSLPHTFKIRDDIHVASGSVQWSVEATPQAGDETRWTGKLKTEDVRVLRNGQPIDWRLPFDVEFAAVDGQEMELEQLTASSFFFTLSGQGNLHEGQIHGKADLERLMYQLGQVLDVNNVYLRGQLQTVLNWRELQPDQLAVENRSRLVDFVMTQNEQLICQEAELNTSARATVSRSGLQIASLDAARVDVVAGSDFLVVELQQPVANPGAEADWQLACRLKGELGSWFHRTNLIGGDPPWQVGGQIDATAQVSSMSPKDAGQEAVDRWLGIHGVSVDLRNLQVVSDAILLQEPIVQIQSAGAIDLQTGSCRFPETRVSSPTIACTAHNIAVQLDPNVVVSGDVDYRADIGRVQAIARPASNDSGHRIQGESTGRLTLKASGARTAFQWQGAVNELHVRDATGASLWQEPQATFRAEGSYDAVADTLRLDRAQVSGKAINLTAAGKAGALTTNPNIDLAGEYGYDLIGITALFRGMLGPEIQLAGQQRHPFSAKGPVFPTQPNPGIVSPELTADFQIGWQDVKAYGISLGAAQVDAAVSQGLMRVRPLNVAVGQGRVRLEPTLHLNTDAIWMTLPAGPVMERIRIDPKMTAGWMQYITPLLAHATSAEGSFSVYLGRTEVPLVDPMQSRVEGQLVIHGGALGPGPMANLVLDLATQVKRLARAGDGRIANSTKNWVEVGEQQIDFQLANGRVYHRGFQMLVDGVIVGTSGSVGVVDQSLDIVATVPFLDEWIGGAAELSGLRGQVISVPIRGTTSRPQIDQRAFRQATMQLARQGVTGYLQNQLGGKLGGELQNALGDSLGNILDGGNPTSPNQPYPAQPPQDLGTQLQNRAQQEINKEINNQLNKLFQ